MTAILSGDFAAALSAARQASNHGQSALYDEVITPALIEVGRLWEQGAISIADEHVATAVAQSVLASFYPAFPWSVQGPRAIVACAPGERHVLGARMVADLLTLDGWDAKFVGGDLPGDALVELAARESPILVGISVAMSERLAELPELIRRLRLAVPRCKVIVGGRAFAQADPVPDFGADRTLAASANVASEVRAWKR